MHLVGWFIWISAFLVHVEGIDTDFLTEEQEQEQEEQEQKKRSLYSLFDNRWRWKYALSAY